MEKHLHTFVNYQQDNQSEKLAKAEFAANNNELAFTKPFLFFASKSLDLHMDFDIIDLSNTSTHRQINKQKALGFSRNMKITQEFIQKAIALV